MDEYSSIKNILAYCLDQTLDIEKIDEAELKKLQDEFNTLTDERMNELGITKSEYSKIEKQIRSAEELLNLEPSKRLVSTPQGKEKENFS